MGKTKSIKNKQIKKLKEQVKTNKTPKPEIVNLTSALVDKNAPTPDDELLMSSAELKEQKVRLGQSKHQFMEYGDFEEFYRELLDSETKSFTHVRVDVVQRALGYVKGFVENEYQNVYRVRFEQEHDYILKVSKELFNKHITDEERKEMTA